MDAHLAERYFNLTLPASAVLFLRLSFISRERGLSLSLTSRALAGEGWGVLPEQSPHRPRLLVHG
jgi:hypothetical protein